LTRTENLFEHFCQFDRSHDNMDISKESLELDDAISLQNYYLIENGPVKSRVQGKNN
jgi:hypothetical protein